MCSSLLGVVLYCFCAAVAAAVAGVGGLALCVGVFDLCVAILSRCLSVPLSPCVLVGWLCVLVGWFCVLVGWLCVLAGWLCVLAGWLFVLVVWFCVLGGWLCVGGLGLCVGGLALSLCLSGFCLFVSLCLCPGLLQSFIFLVSRRLVFLGGSAIVSRVDKIAAARASAYGSAGVARGKKSVRAASRWRVWLTSAVAADVAAE